MGIPALSFLLFVIPISYHAIDEGGGQLARPIGTIVPQPTTPETFSEKPTPLLFRIVNRRKKGVYIQGLQQEGEKSVQIFFYHRKRGKGWKPFFDSLPCDLPTCRNLHALNKNCDKSTPFVIRLGPAGSFSAIKKFQWDGLLYQRIEATGEARKRRYCYRGWVPRRGRIRIEVEYSETIQRGLKKRGLIGDRNHTAIEFSLPPLKKIYEISIGRE